MYKIIFILILGIILTYSYFQIKKENPELANSVREYLHTYNNPQGMFPYGDSKKAKGQDE